MKVKIILLFLFFINYGYSQKTILQGIVIDKFLQSKIDSAEVFLIKREKETPKDIYRNKDVYLDSLYTDSTGKYKFEIIDTGIYIIKAFVELDEKDIDTTFISENEFYIRNYAFEDIWVEIPKLKKFNQKNIEITVYCPYNITKDLKVCPCCLKGDKICEIIYGLPMFLYDNNGKIIEPKEPFCVGGCVEKKCQPTKRCLRCYKDF